MKSLWLTLVLLGAPVAYGYEFKLHFTPAGGAYGLIVAGYEFNGNTVVGNCSYYTVSAGSGRGSRGTTTHHYNTCSWDLYGNLISMTPVSSAPAAPQPISTKGTEIVYAISGGGTTGRDTRGFGFVNTPSSHYTWQDGKWRVRRHTLRRSNDYCDARQRRRFSLGLRRSPGSVIRFRPYYAIPGNCHRRIDDLWDVQ